MVKETFTADCLRFQWLEDRGNGWQFGEQGLIDAILSRLGDGSRRCMEIGAGDGGVLPVTVDRLIKAGWEARLYEIVEYRQKQLRERYGERVDVFGEWQAPGTLWVNDGVVVIDIDGFDCVVLGQVLGASRPAVVICEHYDKQAPSQPSKDEMRPIRPPNWLLGKQIDGGFTVQAPAEVIQNIAGWRGYDRLGTTRVNSIFVRRDLTERLADV